MNSQQSQSLVAVETLLALIFDLLFFTFSSPLRVYSCPPPLFPAIEQLITWSHLFFHNVYYALAYTVLPCTITSAVNDINMLNMALDRTWFRCFIKAGFAKPSQGLRKLDEILDPMPQI